MHHFPSLFIFVTSSISKNRLHVGGKGGNSIETVRSVVLNMRSRIRFDFWNHSNIVDVKTDATRNVSIYKQHRFITNRENATKTHVGVNIRTHKSLAWDGFASGSPIANRLHIPDNSRLTIIKKIHYVLIIWNLWFLFVSLLQRSLKNIHFSYAPVTQEHLIPAFGSIPNETFTDNIVPYWRNCLVSHGINSDDD